MINLKRSNGTLLQTENVQVSSSCENGCKSIELDKAEPAAEQPIYQEVVPNSASGVIVDETVIQSAPQGAIPYFRQ